MSATGENGDTFELYLNTLRTINPEKSSYEVLLNGLKMKIYKAVTEPCWKYLTKEKSNYNFIHDKSMGDANEHYIRSLGAKDDVDDMSMKEDSLTNIIAKLQKLYPNFYLHEY